jgi:thiol-disulfide isomerase/thioredoxin
MRTQSAVRNVLSRRALLTAAAAAALVGCSSQKVDQTSPGGEYEFTGATPAATVVDPAGRAPAPAFDGELLDGTQFESSSLAGDITVINFWGSWCAPCRLETPEFQAVHAELADRGVQFLGVDVKDERQLAVGFMKNVGATYPSLFDPRGEVAMAFRGFPANVVPSTILLDGRGRVAAVYAGAVRGTDLRTALGLLLEESAGE